MSRKTIQQVLTENTAFLMALPGVVGTAVGERAGQPCITVLVVQETPSLLEQIPLDLDGYPVKVKVTGGFRAVDLGG
jgi:hypothetical protein